MKKNILNFFIQLIIFFLLPVNLFSDEIYDYFSLNDPLNDTTVEHRQWEDFLSKYLQVNEGEINLFYYGRVSSSDRIQLQDYISSLEEVAVSRLNRNEQLAFWINLYNAVTVEVVLRHYPVASIRDIRLSNIFVAGPWDKQLVGVEGFPLSLNDIEHRIIRPIFQNPLIHYAVNCASLGCPDLAPLAYRGGTLTVQLHSAAVDFINHPRAVEFRDNRLYLSSIYYWYGDDFGDWQQLINHLIRYAEPNLRRRLQSYDRSAGFDYDWRLNEAAE